MIPSEDFMFGLETEFLLLDAETFRPLWYQELAFEKLNGIFLGLPNRDISMLGLKPHPPHDKLSHYLVEGYHCYNNVTQPVSILPKGIEIRTSVCSSIQETVTQFSKLFKRLSMALLKENYLMCSISHHPRETTFSGPQNHRTPPQWEWAQKAMVTYGPDINIKIPNSFLTEKFWSEIYQKVYFYAPALAATSFNSPFYNNTLWRTDGHLGLSARTFNRVDYAPIFEFHPDQNGRFECNIFEAASSLLEYECFFLMWLSLLTDDSLRGRASAASFKQEMKESAVFGLNSPKFFSRVMRLIESAYYNLPRFGFSPEPLGKFSEKFSQGFCPSIQLQNIFLETGSIELALMEKIELFDECHSPLKQQWEQPQEAIHA